MLHYDSYLELRRLAGAQGAIRVRITSTPSRFVVGREIGGAAGVEVGPMILRVGVSVPCHDGRDRENNDRDRSCADVRAVRRAYRLTVRPNSTV